jgi:hypothetical protein
MEEKSHVVEMDSTYSRACRGGVDFRKIHEMDKEKRTKR